MAQPRLDLWRSPQNLLNIPFLTTVQLAELPFSIAVSRKDKVADGPFVTLEASRTTAGSCLSASCILRSTITCSPIPRKQKIAPKKIRHTTAPEEAFPLVRAGECIAFVVKTGALLLARDGVTFGPFKEPALKLKTYLVSRAGNESKLLSELVRTYMRKLSPLKKDVQSV